MGVSVSPPHAARTNDKRSKRARAADMPRLVANVLVLLIGFPPSEFSSHVVLTSIAQDRYLGHSAAALAER